MRERIHRKGRGDEDGADLAGAAESGGVFRRGTAGAFVRWGTHYHRRRRLSAAVFEEVKFGGAGKGSL